MDFQFAALDESYRKPVIDLFNFYIESSFAAYPENKVSYEAFDMFLKMTKGYPAIVIKEPNTNRFIGFAFLHPYHTFPTFKRTAEVTYFIHPEYTRKGLGSRILNFLVEKAKELKIDNLIASISHINTPSIEFHKKHGFKICGRIPKVGKKQGKDFDIILMQKQI